jgi:hypothetical protein
MNKLTWSLLLIFIFAFLGYIREFFFVHLNVILYEKYYHTTSEAPFPSIMNGFRVFSYDTLYYSKYMYTLLFVLLFFAANYFAVKKLTEKPFLTKLLLYTFAAMFLLAFLSMAYGYFFKERLQADEYTLSRWLMGIAQSPIICLILLASEKLYSKSVPS